MGRRDNWEFDRINGLTANYAEAARKVLMGCRSFGTNQNPLIPQKFLNVVLVLATASPFSAQAQAGNIVLGAGYTSPAPAVVSPGQVITLLVQGVGANLTETVKAQHTPLPTVLAAISARIQQTLVSPASTAVPIFQVVPHLDTCFYVELPSCTAQLTEIVVQIPYELRANPPQFNQSANLAVLVVSENGVDGNAFQLAPNFDRIHIVTNCDYLQPGNVLLPFSAVCGPVVTHSDGTTLVTANNPAAGGEVLVMYAFGLGATKPAVKTGEAAPSPAPTLAQPVLIGFDFRKNAAPQRVEQATPDQPALQFAGLTPGFVGLYQVNFRVPPVPAELPPCDVPTGPARVLSVRSNLTVNISGLFSFDGAPICVAPSN